MNEIFQYGENEITYLKKVDPELKKAIDEIGHIERAVISDLFTSLIQSIVAQQISAKAANTVWLRMQEHFKEITPETINTANIEDIQR